MSSDSEDVEQAMRTVNLMGLVEGLKRYQDDHTIVVKLMDKIRDQFNTDGGHHGWPDGGNEIQALVTITVTLMEHFGSTHSTFQVDAMFCLAILAESRYKKDVVPYPQNQAIIVAEKTIDIILKVWGSLPNNSEVADNAVFLLSNLTDDFEKNTCLSHNDRIEICKLAVRDMEVEDLHALVGIEMVSKLIIVPTEAERWIPKLSRIILQAITADIWSQYGPAYEMESPMLQLLTTLAKSEVGREAIREVFSNTEDLSQTLIEAFRNTENVVQTLREAATKSKNVAKYDAFCYAWVVGEMATPTSPQPQQPGRSGEDESRLLGERGLLPGCLKRKHEDPSSGSSSSA
jgi:hypothetical protein